MDEAGIGPVVVCVRGPSRSGKSTVVQGLIERLGGNGLRIAWVKRTHHPLDLPEKASGRVWSAGPSAMVIAAPDRLQLTLPRVERAARNVLRQVPVDVDLVLFETHEPEAFPTVLAADAEPTSGEQVVARWSLAELETGLRAAESAVRALLPRDLELDRALRAAKEFHGGHACAGLILGTRLALYAGELLGVELPDRAKRLTAAVEIDRCAADAIVAVTGCRPGKRTLRFLDYGKLAATFWDLSTGRAVRVAARGDLRERVGVFDAGRHAAQAAAYRSWPAEELFSVRWVETPVGSLDMPGPPVRRVVCIACGEEVADGRELPSEAGPVCRPCAGA